MDRKELKRYRVPFLQPSDQKFSVHFVRGDTSHFWLAFDNADEISRQHFGNDKVRKWYRHTPRIGTHLYFEEDEYLKRALVTAHDEADIVLMDMDRGDITKVQFLENLFYMEENATSLHALCFSCILSGQQKFDAKCVEEWNAVFEEAMRGSTILARFNQCITLEGDLLPTYEVTIEASCNGVNNLVNVNELLRTASPGKSNLDKLYESGYIANFGVLCDEKIQERGGSNSDSWHTTNSSRYLEHMASPSRYVEHTANSSRYRCTCGNDSLDLDSETRDYGGRNRTERLNSMDLKWLSVSDFSEESSSHIEEEDDVGSEHRELENDSDSDDLPEPDHVPDLGLDVMDFELALERFSPAIMLTIANC